MAHADYSHTDHQSYPSPYGGQAHHVRPRADGQPTIIRANGATIEIRAGGQGLPAPAYDAGRGRAHNTLGRDVGTYYANTRHGTSSDGSDRDVAYYESRCAQYGAIHPDFDTHWRRPWGHAEHRCQPPYQGWWCLLRGYLLNNEELKARGYAEREFAERERKNERRRRWALFKAEIRARRGRSNTPYTT